MNDDVRKPTDLARKLIARIQREASAEINEVLNMDARQQDLDIDEWGWDGEVWRRRKAVVEDRKDHDLDG